MSDAVKTKNELKHIKSAVIYSEEGKIVFVLRDVTLCNQMNKICKTMDISSRTAEYMDRLLDEAFCNKEGKA